MKNYVGSFRIVKAKFRDLNSVRLWQLIQRYKVEFRKEQSRSNNIVRKTKINSAKFKCESWEDSFPALPIEPVSRK